MDLQERRNELVDAMNAHDVEAIRSFVAPSFAAKDKNGKTIWDCHRLLDELVVMFHTHPEFKQSLEIESSTVNGNTATLVTRRVEYTKRLWWFDSNNVSRWTETWNRIDGQWMIVEERLSPL